MIDPHRRPGRRHRGQAFDRSSLRPGGWRLVVRFWLVCIAGGAIAASAAAAGWAGLGVVLAVGVGGLYYLSIKL